MQFNVADTLVKSTPDIYASFSSDQRIACALGNALVDTHHVMQGHMLVSLHEAIQLARMQCALHTLDKGTLLLTLQQPSAVHLCILHHRVDA